MTALSEPTDWHAYFQAYGERVARENALKAGARFDEQGREIEAEAKITVLERSEMIDVMDMPRSPKSIYLRVKSDPRWVIATQRTKTWKSDVPYLSDSETHNMGEIRTPAHERQHLWMRGQLRGDKTVAAFVIEYMYESKGATPGWKMRGARFGDVVSGQNQYTTKATEFEQWLSVFIPKVETPKRKYTKRTENHGRTQTVASLEGATDQGGPLRD